MQNDIAKEMIEGILTDLEVQQHNDPEVERRHFLSSCQMVKSMVGGRLTDWSILYIRYKPQEVCVSSTEKREVLYLEILI